MKNTLARATLIVASIIFVSLLILTGISYAKINPENCVGVWLFDEGAGDVASDSSGNGNDGTLIGGLNWVEGKFGMALEFDGTDDFVEVPDSDSLDITDAITIVAWVNPYEVADQGIVTKRVEEGNEGVYCFASPYAAQAVLGVAINTAWVRPFRGELETEVWQFVAFTYDGSNVIMYEDGEQIMKAPYTQTITTNDRPVNIGQYYSSDYRWKGIIDDVAIFNVALAQDDIEDIMNKGVGMATGIAAVSPSGKLTTTWGMIKDGY